MKNIGKIIKFSKPLHGLMLGLSILILMTATLQQITPLLSKFIVDEIVFQIQNKTGNVNKLAMLIILGFVLNILGTAIQSYSNRLGDHLSGELRKFLTTKFYAKILCLPQSFFDSTISGKISNQLSRGIETIRNFSNTSTNFILPTMMQSIFTIIILAYYSLPVAFFITILFPIYLLLSHHSTKKWGELEMAKNKIEDLNRGRINEVITNIRLVKSFISEPKEFNLVDENLVEINKIYARQSRTYHIIDFARNVSLYSILLIVSIVIFYSTFNGTLTIGEMVLILQLVALARMPLFAMSFIFSQLQSAESGSKEYIEIVELDSVEDNLQTSDARMFKKPSLTFENVGFNYETSTQVLNNVSFDIKHNEKVALVGHSGAGKSTIINLILKFYKPVEGKISIDGIDYTELTHHDIRANIALVLQDNELFSSSIKENVAYGKPDASEDEIVKALKLANAYEFVSGFKDGIDTEIGERGLKLSGGQKQRIQIARAILKNAPILILDEATSSLDSMSESKVQEALENLMKNKLVMIIAHRFSTIQNVDKIIVFDKGKIVDSGTPSELAHRDGIYSQLLKYQIDGNKKLLKEFELY